MLERERVDRYLWRVSLGFLFLSLFPSSRRWTKGNRRGRRSTGRLLFTDWFIREMVRDKDGSDCDVLVTCYARDPNDCFRAAVGSRHVNGIWAGPLSFPGSSAVKRLTTNWPCWLCSTWITMASMNPISIVEHGDSDEWITLRRTSLKDCLTMVLNFYVLSVSSFQLPQSQSAYVNMYNLLPFMDSIIVCA